MTRPADEQAYTWKKYGPRCPLHKTEVIGRFFPQTATTPETFDWWCQVFHHPVIEAFEIGVIQDHASN